jgi:NAD(P)-dependent dehydrogenase (short-subunit alcohol dehydrogenase family)
LGAAIVTRLATEGWSVGCIATSETSASPIADQTASDHGVSTLALGALVEDRAQVDAALARVESELGPVSLMVNNAGIAHVAPFEEVDPADFQRMVDVNLMGVFHGSQLAAQRMIASETSGSIIQLGSIAGINGFPNRVGYCGTKAAVHHMTKVMAVDLARHKIRVNTVAPGYIRTDMVQDLIDAGTLDETRLTGRIPAKDLGTPNHIASCVSWLASEGAEYITGETITVDGGWVAYGHI